MSTSRKCNTQLLSGLKPLVDNFRSGESDLRSAFGVGVRVRGTLFNDYRARGDSGYDCVRVVGKLGGFTDELGNAGGCPPAGS